MKKSFIFGLFLLALAGLARPTLAATYSCTDIANDLYYYYTSDVNTQGEVSLLQKFLIAFDQNTSNPTPALNPAGPFGWFGPSTVKDLKYFQTKMGVDVAPSIYYGGVYSNSKKAIRALTCPPPPTNSITVLTPTSGQAWLAGSTQTIRWSGGDPTSKLIIYVVPANSTTTINNIAAVQPRGGLVNNGSYSWTIPAGFWPQNYNVAIFQADNTSDLGDNYRLSDWRAFTITK